MQPRCQVLLLHAHSSAPWDWMKLWERGRTLLLYFDFFLDQHGQLTISSSTSLRAKQINLYNKGEVGRVACFLVFRALFN